MIWAIYLPEQSSAIFAYEQFSSNLASTSAADHGELELVEHNYLEDFPTMNFLLQWRTIYRLQSPVAIDRCIWSSWSYRIIDCSRNNVKWLLCRSVIQNIWSIWILIHMTFIHVGNTSLGYLELWDEMNIYSREAGCRCLLQHSESVFQ